MSQDEQGIEADGVRPAGGVVRHRQHRFPGRELVVKVRYDQQEHAAVSAAAVRARLTVSGFVAGSALATAGVGAQPSQSVDRELLGELLVVRTALRWYAVNVNQAVAALNSGGPAPVWLERAVAGADRAVGRVDEATVRVSQRLR